MKLPVNYHETHYKERKKVREEYVRIQDGLCYHCDSPLSDSPPKKITSKMIVRQLFPHGFFDWPVHLHHNHETGMTIGVVHCYCNAVLWQHHGE